MISHESERAAAHEPDRVSEDIGAAGRPEHRKEQHGRDGDGPPPTSRPGRLRPGAGVHPPFYTNNALWR